MTGSYQLHGLHITSDVRLPEPERCFDGPADLVIERGDASTVERVPDDAIGIRYMFDDEHVYYEGGRDGDDGWIIRAPGVVDFAFDFSGDRARATARLDPSTDEDLLPMFASGMALACFLALQGHLCLHASAVEADARAVALCAPSGFGKSTLAALAAAGGYPLVADDLLRIDVDAAPPTVYPGASEIRLREGAAALIEHWPDHSRITADGRTAVAPPHTTADRLPLAAIVLPVLDRERTDVEVEQLRPSEAFTPLLGCPRLLGWREPQVVQRQFEQLTALAASVPVVIARVPWRTPAEPAIGAQVIERVLDGH